MTPPCHGCDLHLPTDEHGCCSRCAATYVECDVGCDELADLREYADRCSQAIGVYYGWDGGWQRGPIDDVVDHIRRAVAALHSVDDAVAAQVEATIDALSDVTEERDQYRRALCDIVATTSAAVRAGADVLSVCREGGRDG